MAKKGLGRGFSSLIPTEMLIDDEFDPTLGVDEKISKLQELPLSEVMADPEQPRRYFDEDALQDLANSVKIHGVLQPIVVVKNKDKKLSAKYVIVAGERRFRASGLAGLDKIPAIVRDLSGQNRLELSLIENLQRSDLNILETATAYLKLREQFNMTAEQIGERVGGRSSSAVLNTMRLLNLPDFVKQHVSNGDLKEGQARPLLKADEETIKEILPKILAENWSARKIEQFMVQLKKRQEQGKETTKLKPENTPLDKTIKRISSGLKSDVNIRMSARGTGEIRIKFKNEDDLKRLEKMLSDQK
ncbi:MAG: ParB/RepB/Spo0J family partition protein [Candidatus Sacchiramonaceae bacterium]|nr:ParB/RepB/Spo0J family partition protein [Candidatus Saccharimonadaceae bacterium]